MDYWHATIRCTFDDRPVAEELTAVAETLLADHIGHLTIGPHGRTASARLYVVADRAAAATGKALRVLDQVAHDSKWPAWMVTEVHARLHFSRGREVASPPGDDAEATVSATALPVGNARSACRVEARPSAGSQPGTRPLAERISG